MVVPVYKPVSSAWQMETQAASFTFGSGCLS